MNEYRIRPIATCQGERDSSHWTYQLDVGKKTGAGFYAWYLEGSNPRTLVDTGARAENWAGTPHVTRDVISVEEGLRRLGLNPQDIQIVIVTHLHFDHIALGHLYPNAKFIVQKKELDYALSPHPMDALFYDRSLFSRLNFEVVDGTCDILPGVSVFLTPGHSPGGQSVAVNVASRKAIITGFCCSLANFTQTETMKHRGWEVVAPGLHQDCREAYDSVNKVKGCADIILPLHEPKFINMEAIQ